MDIRERLAQELDEALTRLRQQEVALEELPGPIGESAATADPMDDIQLAVERDISFATRSLLFERANRLAVALDRLREGTYGICVECEHPIPSARLAALPEVTTCVGCQDRLERARRSGDDRALASVGFGDDEE